MVRPLSSRRAIEDGRLSPVIRLLAFGAFLAPAVLAAQQAETEADPQAASAFVEQAPQEESAVFDARPVVEDNSSKVYFPDEITPESVAAARARAAQAQMERARNQDVDPDVAQLSQTGEGGREVEQLSDGQSAEVLAQLTPAQREVLIDAVEGTDICDQEQSIPALRALCEDRLETRSAEFTQSSQGATAAEAILGESLDSDRIATLEAAIARLAKGANGSSGVDDSVIASVAFTNQNAVSNEAAVESDPANDLTPETQAVVNAIVQQLGGP